MIDRYIHYLNFILLHLFTCFTTTISFQNIELRKENHALKLKSDFNSDADLDLLSTKNDTQRIVNILKTDNENLEIELSDTIDLLNQHIVELDGKDDHIREYADLVSDLENTIDSLKDQV